MIHLKFESVSGDPYSNFNIWVKIQDFGFELKGGVEYWKWNTVLELSSSISPNKQKRCKTKWQDMNYFKEKLASVDELLNSIIP
jgi:hypothetical protein